MDLSLDSNKGNYQIRSYEPGKVTINDKVYTQSVVVSLSNLILWRPQSMKELTSADFEIVLAQDSEIVILGTGTKQIFPSPQQLQLLSEKNMGVDVMTTAAACRTYNVLASEGRKVVAALLL